MNFTGEDSEVEREKGFDQVPTIWKQFQVRILDLGATPKPSSLLSYKSLSVEHLSSCCG